MTEKTIIELLHQKTASLHGKVAAYDKFMSKLDFLSDCTVLTDRVKELLVELEKVLEEKK